MPVNDQTPDVTLFDSDGVEMNVVNGVVIPANTAGVLAMGQDAGGIARRILTFTDGTLVAYLPVGAQLLRVNTGWVISGVISAAPATLRDFSFIFKGPSMRWLMLFDTVAVPANGAVPFVAPMPLASGVGMRVSGSYSPQAGDRFPTGISFALSTTEDTLTIGAAANVWVTSQYTSM